MSFRQQYNVNLESDVGGHCREDEDKQKTQDGEWGRLRENDFVAKYNKIMFWLGCLLRHLGILTYLCGRGRNHRHSEILETTDLVLKDIGV